MSLFLNVNDRTFRRREMPESFWKSDELSLYSRSLLIHFKRRVRMKNFLKGIFDYLGEAYSLAA